MRKRIAIIVFVVVFIAIVYLTLQSPDETGALTKMAQRQLLKIGIDVGLKPLRHYVHYVLYFILGLSACTLCLTQDWSLWIGLMMSSAIGVFDEGIKVLLPTREFDVTDLIRDFIGVAVSAGIVVLIRRVKAVK